MNNFENPIHFDIKKMINGIEVIYFDLMEISQGGPETGSILINENQIQSYRFGGPCLCEGGYVYAPVYKKKLFSSGFKLSRINLQTLQTESFGEIKDLIFLDKIEGNRVYFFEDLDKIISNYYDI